MSDLVLRKHTHTPLIPRDSIQRSLSAVQTLGGGNSSSSLVPPTLNASNSDLPPLSELSPSGASGVGIQCRKGQKKDGSTIWTLSFAPQILKTHLHNTGQAVRGAWATLKARESSLWDRVTAAKVLLFLTFEDPSSRFVKE